MGTPRNPKFGKLSTEQLNTAIDKARVKMLKDPRTTLCTEDPVIKNLHDLMVEKRVRQALA